MPRQLLASNVFDAAYDRISGLYAAGHRVVASFSGGKDSGIVLELCILAARMTGRLPVDVVMRDEEVMFPGTFEYAERVAARPEVRFQWVIAHQPILNYFARGIPYWWVFDPLVPPEQWVRQPPAIATTIQELAIQSLVTREKFPPAPGKELFDLLGLRAAESRTRALGVQSSMGWLTKVNGWGCRKARPIYDWTDGDVWKALHDNQWDYNSAYDVMHRKGVPRSKLRIAPPTMALAGIRDLQKAAEAWPRWFDRVCKRLPGIRSAAMYGREAVTPQRRLGEGWGDCYRRCCIAEAPAWIAERARITMEQELAGHARHSTQPYPEKETCLKCPPMLGNWADLAKAMYMGDVFSQKQHYLPEMEPEFFRPGAGIWGKGGKPSW